MAEVWGEMPKAQDNNQTIEEAIAAAIVSHEADSSAHLGTGESLEAHKTSEVLDHAAGSVVADKITATEMKIETLFEDPDMINVTGTRFSPWWPGVMLTVNPTGINDSYFSLTVRGLCSIPNYSKNHLWEWVIQVSIQTNSHDRFFYGLSDDETLNIGWGFKFDYNVVKAFYDDDDTSFVSGDLSIDPTATHTYRVYFDAVLQKMFWFVDGVEKYSNDIGTQYDFWDIGTAVRAYNTGGGNTLQDNIKCYRFTVSREI